MELYLKNEGIKKKKKRGNETKRWLGLKQRKKITGVQSTKGVKKGKREKETGDLNSIEYLKFFCLRGFFSESRLEMWRVFFFI